jgi:ornithine carbamoyltransferase
MAQQNVMEKWDFILVSLNGTHPPMPVDNVEIDNAHPCQSIGRLSRFCSLSSHTRSPRYSHEKTGLNGVTICCFEC